MVNNILIEVLSSMAQQERETIRKRQREGIDAAKKRGKYLGRPTVKKPENFDAVIKRWRNGKITAREAMRETELKKSSFYRLASKLGNEVIR
jgi:DNA invertase Pin-like site-specific DNA recombinase